MGDDTREWSLYAVRIASDTLQFSVITQAPVWDMFVSTDGKNIADSPKLQEMFIF